MDAGALDSSSAWFCGKKCSEGEETCTMNLPPETFDPTCWHEIQAGETVHTGPASITHTGNDLQEIRMQTPAASLILTLAKGGTIAKSWDCQKCPLDGLYLPGHAWGAAAATPE
jgi:hypothetical protein